MSTKFKVIEGGNKPESCLRIQFNRKTSKFDVLAGDSFIASYEQYTQALYRLALENTKGFMAGE